MNQQKFLSRLRKMSRLREKKTNRKVEYLEVVDKNNQPIGAFSRNFVHQHNLLHRSVLVLFYNKEKKLFLQQRSHKKYEYPGYWDLSATGHVQLGESREEAAFRELEEELGLRVNKLKLLHEVPPQRNTDYEFVSLFTTTFSSHTPSLNSKEIQRGMFVERHELEYLVQAFSEVLTPGLIYFWNLGCLFNFSF